jgi:hypothetical protein
MTRAQYEQFVTGLHHLASDIGLNPAARALGINPSRARKIASRRKWNISRFQPALNGYQAREALSQKVTPIEVKQRLLEQGSTRTKLALSSAATTASEHLATLDGAKLLQPHSGIAADTWSRTADRVHGWTAERAKPLVQIANVVLPNEQEREERQKSWRALEEIARSLAKKSQ